MRWSQAELRSHDAVRYTKESLEDYLAIDRTILVKLLKKPGWIYSKEAMAKEDSSDSDSETTSESASSESGSDSGTTSESTSSESSDSGSESESEESINTIAVNIMAAMEKDQLKVVCPRWGLSEQHNQTEELKRVLVQTLRPYKFRIKKRKCSTKAHQNAA